MTFRRTVTYCLFVCTLLLGSSSYAATNNKFAYPFYAGVTGGYGKTTWQGLVPPEDKQNLAMELSTPKYVNEGGLLWGLFAGYELLPYFALEASYMHYPDATIAFDSSSIFSFEHDDITTFTSKTEEVSLMAKS